MTRTLDADVSYVLMKEAFRTYRDSSDFSTILNLSSTCRAMREAGLSVVFADVHWPHANKNDEDTGLHFFPKSLWRYFRRFALVWPDDWPDSNPPRWGDRYYQGGDYHPRHLDKLTSALPKMKGLSTFYMSCPFYPPSSILNALVQCTSLRQLSVNDTPLYISMIPKIPSSFHLDRLSIVPIAEAVRVGEGASDLRYSERTYFIREYRQKYKNDILARFAATDLLFKVGKAAHLKFIQLSVDLCPLDNLVNHEWPNLETLVLTGHTPRGATQFLDILAQMPRLSELRLLFTKTKTDPGYRLLVDHQSTLRNSSPTLLGQLKRFAISNACSFEHLFQYVTGIERLAVLAIIDQPWVPIALSRADVNGILKDLSIAAERTPQGKSSLKRLRIMIEDKVNPVICENIIKHFPNLEALELEVCGYHDGKSIYEWSAYADAFSPIASKLRELRVCIQFQEYDEMDKFEPWHAARKECGHFLASRLPALERVGFEYRKRVGTHRFEDSWLEFAIKRSKTTGEIKLKELPSTWYRYPEVWFPEPLPTAAAG